MKKITTFITLVSFAVVLFSCGGGGSTESSSSPKDPEKKKSVEITATIENGKVVYDKICIACHMTGVAGAASLTDKPRWEEMAAKGMKTLHQSVITGIPEGNYGVMPERGSCTDCSDQDLYDGIAYMLKEAGVTAK